jgi:putative DNA primase/helicase
MDENHTEYNANAHESLAENESAAKKFKAGDESVSRIGNGSDTDHEAAAAYDTVTILTVRKPLVATKRIILRPSGQYEIVEFGDAKYFAAFEREVKDIDDLATLLGKIELYPRAMAVRGGLLPDADPKKVRRLLYDRAGDPDGKARFAEVPRRWLLLDFDAMDASAGVDPLDGPACARIAAAILPAAFQNVTCWWQLTSSAGIKPGIRLRLAYWLSRPLDEHELKGWLPGKPLDHSVFGAVQPIYVARPVFEGCEDPVAQRSGLLRGDRDEVPVPDVLEPAKGRGNEKRNLGYAAWCALIGDHEGGEGFNGPIKGAIGAWVGKHGAKHPTTWLAADIEQKIRKADRSKHTDGDIEERIRGLDTLIAWTVEREAQKRPKGIWLSEQWLAQLFAAENREEMVFTPIMERWHQWDGAIWRRDDKLIAFSTASALCRRIAPTADDHKAAKAAASAKTRAAVVSLAKEELVVGLSEWNADPWLLGTPGGILDLRTGKFRDGRDYVNRAVRAPPQWPEYSCPLWLKTIDEIFQKDDEMIAYVQRLAGYCLTGSVREEALFFLFGEGGTGKGSFIETLLYSIGDYGITVPMTTLVETRYPEHATEIAKLHGARLAVASETKEGDFWDTGRIRALTGGDRLSGRFMRQDHFDFYPTHKLVVSSNNRPNLAQVDDAMRRRMQEVPFNRSFTDNPDVMLKARLKEEAAGILGWMIEGCASWLSEGLKPPAAVVEASCQNLEAADVVNQFIDGCCVEDSTAKEPMPRFYGAWCKWCRDRERPAGSPRDFQKQMLKKWQYSVTDEGRHLYLVGLRVAREGDA